MFLDFPLDHVFGEADAPETGASLASPGAVRERPGDDIERVAALLRDAERPVIMAGAGLYWGRGEESLRALAEELQIPVFLNGLARGCLPADHELAFSRARSTGLRGADVALVIGAPLDFRLGFGAAFAPDAEIVAIDVAEPERDPPRAFAAELYGALPATLDALRAAAPWSAGSSERAAWIDSLRTGPRARAAPPRPPSWATTALRFTRCASTASCRACSTATRS